MAKLGPSYTVNTYETRAEAESVAKRYRDTGRYAARVVKHRDEERYRVILRAKG